MLPLSSCRSGPSQSVLSVLLADAMLQCISVTGSCQKAVQVTKKDLACWHGSPSSAPVHLWDNSFAASGPVLDLFAERTLQTKRAIKEGRRA